MPIVFPSLYFLVPHIHIGIKYEFTHSIKLHLYHTDWRFI